MLCKLIGQKIKALREAKGMSQQQLANKVGGDRQYINKVELGKKNPTIKYLEKVIDALEASANEFLNQKM